MSLGDATAGTVLTLFARHLLSYWSEIREVRGSFGGSIDGSARVLSDSLTRSEEAASGYSQRADDGACSNKFFHFAISLRCKCALGN
jgi:hypothetical protein